MTNQEFIESIRLEGEEWRDVVGYKGYYVVSNFARIIALNRKDGIPYCGRAPHLMSPYLTKKGYLKVCLSKDGTSKAIELHRIVALAFIPNPNGYKYIDHIDTNKENNTVPNLRWCTAKENANNPITKEHYRKYHIGKRNAGRLRPVVAIKNGDIIKVYETLADVIQDGFSKSSVWQACAHPPKKPKGFRWMYLSDYENLVNMSKNFLPNPDTD